MTNRKWTDKVYNGKQMQNSVPQTNVHPTTEFGLEILKKDLKIVEPSLHLTVYAPENVEKKKPVMVWIHGGGWAFGSPTYENGAVLAGFGDVVVVSISYRLHILGFLFGNWGLFDQLEALRWVQNNVGEYGGDKNNVTIFGESAGSWSCEALLCTKLSTGLFHRAICQSGSIKSTVFTRLY